MRKTTTRILKSSASALALTALTMGSWALCAPAMAQEAEDDDTVVVTGIRASLASAQSIKQNAEQFVDSIVAVDIGKLPDVNVAEALQRVSGIQITRNRGEGSSIAIRGLTQVRTELNGRDIFSTTDGRGLSWEDVPSELLAGIDVYKNPSAALIEGGVGGTVNLRTRMPFDAEGRVLSASAGATYFDLREETGQSYSALYSDRWETGAGEFGFLANLSFSEAFFREDSITVEPFFERTDIPGYLGTPVQVAAGGGVSSWNGDRTRTGAAFAVQWRPNNDVELYAQALTSHYEFYDPQTGLFGYGPSGSGGSLTPAPGVNFEFDGDGNMRYGAFSGGQFYQSFTRDDERVSETSDFAIGGSWNANESLTLSTDLQYVTSTTENESATGFGGLNSQPTLYVDLRGDLPRFWVEPSDFLTDPDNYQYQALMVRSSESEGDQIAWRGDAEWDFEDGWADSISVGLRATSRDVEFRESGFDWAAISGPPWDGSPAATVTYSEFPEYYAPNPHIGDFFRGDGTNIWGPHFIVDPALMRDRANALAVLGGLNPAAGAPTGFTPRDQINTQHEETYSAFTMVRFGDENAGLPYDGNVGVRIVNTQLEADGVTTITYRNPAAPGTDIVISSPLANTQDYTEILPSLNLRFFLQDDLFLRFAAARGLSRPAFGDLAANFSLSESWQDTDSNPATPPVLVERTGSGGNPGLRPLTNNQVDLALEWYPRETTSLYATVFYKQVFDFTQTGIYYENYVVPGAGSVPFEITARVNGEEGTIKGFEIGGNTFFDFLPGVLSNFGVQANYTYVDSEAPSPSAVDSAGRPLIVPLEFLSENSYNFVVFYEDGPLTARLAYNWRDQYVITTAGNGTGNLPIYNDEFGQLDGSVTFDFNQHVALSIDGSNLLDEQRETFQAFPGRPRDYLRNDRRVGVRLRLRN